MTINWNLSSFSGDPTACCIGCWLWLWLPLMYRLCFYIRHIAKSEGFSLLYLVKPILYIAKLLSNMLCLSKKKWGKHWDESQSFLKFCGEWRNFFFFLPSLFRKKGSHTICVGVLQVKQKIGGLVYSVFKKRGKEKGIN